MVIFTPSTQRNAKLPPEATAAARLVTSFSPPIWTSAALIRRDWAVRLAVSLSITAWPEISDTTGAPEPKATGCVISISPTVADPICRSGVVMAANSAAVKPTRPGSSCQG